MKCNEARRMVVPYVKKELSEREMEAFLQHIESCEDCMDELDMYYTVYHALNAMDSGTHHEYDFKKMLAEDIRSSKRTVFRNKVLRVLHVILVFVAEVMLFLCVFTGVRIKQGISEDSFFDRVISRLYEETEDIGVLQTETELSAAESSDTESAEKKLSEMELGGTGSAEAEGGTDG